MKKIKLTCEFTLQILSDIHLELRKELPNVPVQGTALALCGDIGKPGAPLYKEFLSWASENYSVIFLIAGNHEYYNGYFDSVDKEIAEIASQFDNVHFLNNEIVEVTLADSSKVRVFGATLWSKVTREAAYLVSDYSRIKKHGARFTPSDTLARHEETVSLLSEIINEHSESDEHSGVPLVVLTHHLPSYKCIHDEYKRVGVANSAYATDLDRLIRRPVILWAHGHSHKYGDQMIGPVRVVSNPMGYPGEDMRNELVVDIETAML